MMVPFSSLLKDIRCVLVRHIAMQCSGRDSVGISEQTHCSSSAWSAWPGWPRDTVCWAALDTINTQSAASNKRNTEFCLSWQLAIDYRLVSTLLVKWRQSTLKTRLRLPPICGGGRLCWFLFEELWNFAPSLVRCGGGGAGAVSPLRQH